MALLTALAQARRGRDLPEWLTLAAGAGPLLIAALAQTLGGLVPCALCYLERWPYRAAIIAARWAAKAGPCSGAAR
jgi:disulfide bond formation protein DsbB